MLDRAGHPRHGCTWSAEEKAEPHRPRPAVMNRREVAGIEAAFKDKLGIKDRDHFRPTASFSKADHQERMEDFLDKLDVQVYRIGEHSRKERFRWSEDKDEDGYDPKLIA